MGGFVGGSLLFAMTHICSHPTVPFCCCVIETYQNMSQTNWSSEHCLKVCYWKHTLVWVAQVENNQQTSTCLQQAWKGNKILVSTLSILADLVFCVFWKHWPVLTFYITFQLLFSLPYIFFYGVVRHNNYGGELWHSFLSLNFIITSTPWT